MIEGKPISWKDRGTIGKRDKGLELLEQVLHDFETMSVEEYEKLYESSKSIADVINDNWSYMIEEATMKIGDKVYVEDFDGKKKGPFVIVGFEDSAIVTLDVGNEDVKVAYKVDCEPVKPRIEQGRLCKFWDDCAKGAKRLERIGKFVGYAGYNYDGSLPMDTYNTTWDHVEPLYRRWDELTENEQARFRSGIENAVQAAVSMEQIEKIYKRAYDFVTEEEHPIHKIQKEKNNE